MAEGRTVGALPPSVIAAFRCPTCAEPGAAAPAGLRCAKGHLTPWRHGYLDATAGADPLDTATRRTFDSFGYEWTRFSQVNAEDEIFWRRYFADVDLSSLRGRLGLDAGCGKGRFSRFTASHLGALVASDGSSATEAAAANLADQPNACVVKADLRSMPFHAGSFGFISCLGVLHHLPDPRAGLDSLARLLAPGGIILVYLYSRPDQPGLRSWALQAASQLRRATVRTPRAVLRPICWPLAAALYGAFVLPGALGQRLHIERLASIPLATYRGSPLRSLWLDTFDRLSAPLETRYTPAEAEAMFAGCGLSIIALRSDRHLAGLVVLAEHAES
ncbi:MAG: class I SAM-dependent methyltransferase [Actinomycetota bacterium]|nr:class I SAM-dependent methyltransferase [Actinomycetota bacterium]